MNRTDRLMGILLELQAREELRAEDLAARFEVSVRTIYRDLQALSEDGVPLVATPGKGYRLMEGYFLPPLSFTASEAAVLALGGAFVRARVDPELQRSADDALRKLTSVLPPERREAVARWQRELHFATFPSIGGEPRLLEVRAAIQERRVLRLVYHAFRRPGAEQREVEPVALIHLGQDWHLAAYCRLRQAPRFFRLDRIDGLEVLGERFELAERHALERYQGDQMRGYAEARLRFDPAVLRWVRERQPYVFLREELDLRGPVFVYALRDEQQLLSWVLAWGSAVEVIEPPEFRQRVAVETRAILARHEEPANFRKLVGVASAPDRTLSGGLS